MPIIGPASMLSYFCGWRHRRARGDGMRKRWLARGDLSGLGVLRAIASSPAREINNARSAHVMAHATLK